MHHAIAVGCIHSLAQLGVGVSQARNESQPITLLIVPSVWHLPYQVVM